MAGYLIKEDVDIPITVFEKWQHLLDLAANLLEIPAALIMKLSTENLEVLVKSDNPENIYTKGEKASLGTGLYCEEVIRTREKLIVTNALKDPKWQSNPDICRSMISYMGFPIFWPTGEVFGTICVLDIRERIYTETYENLLSQFAQFISDDLRSFVDQQRLVEESKQRARAEDKVRISEEKFKKMFFQSPFPITIMTLPEGILVDVNEAFLKDYCPGKTRADVLGKTTLQLDLPTDRMKRGDRLRRLTQGDRIEDEEMTISLPGGQKRNVFVSSQTIKLAGDVYAFTTFFDITVLKNTEKDLQQLNQRVALATDAGGIGIWDWDIKEDRLIWDDRMYQIYGLDSKPDKETYTDWTKYLHPEDRQKAIAETKAAIAGTAPYDTEFRLVRPDGSIVNIKAMGTVIFDPQGEPERMLGVNLDVTERRQTLDRLAASEARYKSLFNHKYIVKLLIDVESGDIIEANDAACDFYGFSHEVMTTKKVWDINVAGEDFVREKLWETYDNRSNYVETKHKRWDGGIADVAVFSGYMEINNRKMVYAIVMDISAKKNLERERESMAAQLLQKQKLESIGLLAGGVAHEINNPIFGIINYAQLISDGNVTDGQIKEYSSEIISEGRRIAEIVKNLLSFARQEKHSFSPAEMVDIINHTLTLVQTLFKKDQIAIELEIQEELPKIVCRSQQIQQVLLNLLTNSRDALNARYSGFDENKRIIISSRLVKKENEEWIVTVVEDFGQGIKKELMEKIFDPFFTTKSRDQGTGLGLSISHGIVENHKGKLYFESEEGAYTRAYLELPVNYLSIGDES